MHAIKGGWVGQTFALAKSNDAGGRKSRIRRSKEERKAMVESFIKTYQKLNNGNFPSLNLTHKEVGGSFYTVREIVREIIQENRVLGPAKLNPEEQINLLSEPYKLGSVSTEPQLDLTLSTNGISSYQITSEGNGQDSGPEHHWLANSQLVNGNQEDEKVKEADELVCTQLLVGETSRAKNDVEEEEAYTAKVSQVVADVVVEAFPSRPAAKPTYNMDGISDKAKDSGGTLINEVEPSKVSSVSKQSFPNISSSLVDEKAMANLEGSILERESGFENEEATVNLEDQSLGSPLRSASREEIVEDKKVKEADELVRTQLRVGETSTAKNVEKGEAHTIKVSQVVADVVVETFPLRPAGKRTYDMDRTSDKSKESGGTLMEEVESRKVGSVSKQSSLKNSSSLVNEKAVANLEGSVLETKSGLNEETTVNLKDQSLKSPHCSPTREDVIHGVLNGLDHVESTDGVLMSGTDELRWANDGIKPTMSTNGMPVYNLNGSNTSRTEDLNFEEASVTVSTVDKQPGSSPEKQGNPTLDRINLESWEGATKKPAEPETNPLLAFFKAFVAAFVKFWSE